MARHNTRYIPADYRRGAFGREPEGKEDSVWSLPLDDPDGLHLRGAVQDHLLAVGLNFQLTIRHPSFRSLGERAHAVKTVNGPSVATLREHLGGRAPWSSDSESAVKRVLKTSAWPPTRSEVAGRYATAKSALVAAARGAKKRIPRFPRLATVDDTLEPTPVASAPAGRLEAPMEPADVVAKIRSLAEDPLRRALLAQWHRVYGHDMEPSVEIDWVDPRWLTIPKRTGTLIEGYACLDHPVVYGRVYLGQAWLHLFESDPGAAIFEHEPDGEMFVLHVDAGPRVGRSVWVPRAVPETIFEDGTGDDWIIISARMEIGDTSDSDAIDSSWAFEHDRDAARAWARTTNSSIRDWQSKR